MKTKLASLLVVLLVITTQCMAQNHITVSAQNDDISNNLDLKAVATAFGESANLQDFEKRLNDYDSGISNLDLNNDGQVDYLRVIEKTDNGIHVVEIQAVLAKDVYQDVASIVVEKDQNDNPTVQVIGDPYIYGDNYIIEPAYTYTPSIFSFFWGPNYFSWYSPFYWGYYPHYYRFRRPFELDIYRSNIYAQINHNQRYYYTNQLRDNRALILQSSIRRNDYANRYPDRSFSARNINVRNKRDFEFNRNGVNYNQSRSNNMYQTSPNGTRNVRSYDNSGVRPQSNGYNARSYSAPMNNGNSGVQRTNNYQQRVNTDNVNRNNNSVQRQNYNRPAQVSQPKPVIQRSNNNVNREVKSENRSENRSENKSENRR